MYFGFFSVGSKKGTPLFSDLRTRSRIHYIRTRNIPPSPVATRRQTFDAGTSLDFAWRKNAFFFIHFTAAYTHNGVLVEYVYNEGQTDMRNSS